MFLDVLRTELITAFKDKDTLRVSVLRYLLAQIKNKEIELRSTSIELTDDDITKVLKKQIKNRGKSIEQF